ncbi:MAG: hypothetical protein D6723_17355 [Acidobacteria bacterium]|nr:MAG: hypothetical protein D6723_17355 [Acidobacteriota bacterium]
MLESGAGPWLTFESPAIPDRWFVHSVFDHRAHRALACVACHAGVSESRRTADVLLPGIQSCRACHSGDGGARTSCVECHEYHQWTRERDLDGPLTFGDLGLEIRPAP